MSRRKESRHKSEIWWKRVDTIVVLKVDKLTKSTRLLDAFKWLVAGSASIITTVPAFVKKHDYRMVEEVRFEKALEHQFSNRG